MRLLIWAAALGLAAGPATAAEQTIAVVQSAHAAFSGHALVVSATVGLPNSCWSNPRFEPPPAGVKPDAAGLVPVTVVADSSEGPGVMCSMIFRTGVEVPALRWRHPPRGLKAVSVIGSTTPVVARVVW